MGENVGVVGCGDVSVGGGCRGRGMWGCVWRRVWRRVWERVWGVSVGCECGV